MAPINIYYQNVRGLRTKTAVFYRNVCINNFDIVCLTETWLLDGISDSELFDDRYLVWRRDRDYTHTSQIMGGGVLIAVKRELAADTCSEWCSSAEDLWVTLTLHHKKPRVVYKMHICVVYVCCQNQGNSLTVQLSNFSDNVLETTLSHPCDKFIVLGDFNQPNIVWQRAGDGQSLYPTNVHGIVQTNFIDNFNTCNLMQYNSHSNINGRILDLVFSNDEIIVSCCDDPLVPEDPHHRALCVTAEFVELHRLPGRSYVKFLYKSADYENIKGELNSIDWQSELSSRSLEEAVTYFYGVISRLHSMYIPSKTVVPKSKYPPWYKSPLIKILKEKAKFHTKFKKYRNLSDYQSFIILRQRAKDIERDMFDNYIAKIESDIRDNPRAFWRYVKSRKQSCSYPSVMQFGQVTSSDGDVICDMFVNCFRSNFLDDTVNTNSQSSAYNIIEGRNDTTHDISQVEIRLGEVCRLLKQVNLNKSAGPDNISPIFIVNCAKDLSVPLSMLFEKSLATGVVPKIWKSAYITPIHKKGSRTLVENYRPISKLCVFVKILEKIVYAQVYSALKLSFSENQHGFLRGRSTSSNLTVCSDYLSECMSQRSQVDVIYTDYSKCFDRIDHLILLRKLLSVGIRGDLYRWFRSYVENRCQTVVLNGYCSKPFKVPSGVPQGSLLGPLLFNIFINDISSSFRYSKLLLYADDMKIMRQINTLADAHLLQADLNNFQGYCINNKLDLNVSKCYICSFTRKPIPIIHNYMLLDTALNRVNTIRDLGVIFDSKLLFDAHIDNIVKKASKALGFVLRVSSDFKSIKTIKILYCSFVRSHLEYASQVWNPNYNVYINRIESIQKRFLRHIQYRSKTFLASYVYRCKKFHILPLYERRKISDLVFLFKIANGITGVTELLHKIGLRVPSAFLRRPQLLHTPVVATVYRQNSYMVRASRMYNTTCWEADIDIFNTSVAKLRRILTNSFFEGR